MKTLDFDGMKRRKEEIEKQKKITAYQNEIFFDNIGKSKKKTNRSIKSKRYKIDTKVIAFENKTILKRKFFVFLKSKTILRVVLITENPKTALRKLDKLNE